MSSGMDEAIMSVRLSGTKYDDEKPPISLMPREFLEGTAKAFAYGAKKYGKHNYRQGIEMTRLLDAAMRHIIAFSDNEDLDKESGQSHLAHAAASIAMAFYMQANKPELDDRFKKGSR